MFVQLKPMMIAGVVALVACAAPPRADLESDVPQDAIAEVETMEKRARASQVDLLATEPFHSGVKNLKHAKESYRDGDRNSVILEKLSRAKAYFQNANRLADSRVEVPSRLLAARKSILDAQVSGNPDLIKRLQEIDDSLRSESDAFTKKLAVEVFSKFQKEYFALEISIVQDANLRGTRSIVEDARNNDALGLAPETFNLAMADLRTAENLIQQSPRSRSIYESSVENANQSAKLLNDVMTTLRGVAKGSSESAALKLVSQDRALGFSSNRIRRLQGSLTTTQSDLTDVASKLNVKTREANQSEKEVRFQKAMSAVREQFAKDEAEVYQQGNDLIIRLKTIAFRSGSAMFPSQSMKLLSKVSSIIESLNPNDVTVQGHTDSIGMKMSNQILSQKRSETVAKYFRSLRPQYNVKSEGFGEDSPIANNETKKGRSMNRRVDILVSASQQI